MSMPTIKVTKKGADRVRSGHLWIYRSDVLDTSETTAGAIVTVVDQAQNFVGQAIFSDVSEISLRFLTQSDEEIDRDWWRRKIRAAASRRANIAPGTNAYRLVYSEGDLLPSLIVDRYNDVLVLQTLSQGTEAVKQTLLELLVDEFGPRAIVERNDARVRELEGLPLTAGTLYGTAPDELEILQDGIRFMVSPLGGQKTGSFLDQRENRLAARALAHGRALDCFTFTGAFALHLAQVCEHVIGIDISGPAIAAAHENAKLNSAQNVEFREANVFDSLRELESESERFDTIILDPPAFAKNRRSIKPALRGYKEINLRALKLLNPGGVLITCTCSYHMSEQMFLEVIGEAAKDAHRKLQVVEKRMQASDHPVILSMPETYYLKCVIARVIE
jgi:23S rRNA (cytosine1962-C5)-methyltransferase